MKRYSESQDDWGMVEDEDGLYVQYSDVKNLERQLAEVKSDLSYLSTAIGTGFLPDESDFNDKMIAQRALRAANAHGAVKRAEQAEQRIFESQEQYGFQPEFFGFKQRGCGCKYAVYELQLTDCGGEFEGEAPRLFLAPIIPPTVEEAVKALPDAVPHMMSNERAMGYVDGWNDAKQVILDAAIRERGEK